MVSEPPDKAWKLGGGNQGRLCPAVYAEDPEGMGTSNLCPTYPTYAGHNLALAGHKCKCHWVGGRAVKEAPRTHNPQPREDV